jgi:hypothetical protein
MSQPATRPVKRIPPYLPFKTFLSSVEALSQGVPPKIDRTLWRNQSGINQGLIMAAYRFLGLVKDGDTSTVELASLAGNPSANGPKVMRDIVNFQYAPIIRHDLTKMTMKMLDTAFDEHFQVSGATKQKAITFFLKASKFADLPLSPYLLTQLRNSSKKPRKPRQREQENGNEHSVDVFIQDPNAISHKVELASGGTLTVVVTANPFGMTPEDRQFVFSMIDMVQNYQKADKQTQT